MRAHAANGVIVFVVVLSMRNLNFPFRIAGGRIENPPTVTEFVQI